MMAAHPARRIQGIESAEFSPETRFQAARSASSYTAWRRMPLDAPRIGCDEIEGRRDAELRDRLAGRFGVLR
jgi:hypothetical protein